MSGDAAEQFNIHDAKTNLSIIISRAGRPVAKVIPLAGRIQRAGRGSLRGQLVLTPDWDSDAVNESIAADFGATS